MEDGTISVVYAHDDNIGPNVRFRISARKKDKVVLLVPEQPKPHNPSPSYPRAQLDNYPEFIPEQMLVAVHDDMRTSPDKMHRVGIFNVGAMSSLLNRIARDAPSLTFATRFVRLANYLGVELEKTISNKPEILSKVRLALCENVQPMSLHLGLVRVALEDSTPLLDILYDTTDSDRNHPVFAHLAFNTVGETLLRIWSSASGKKFGTTVHAF